MTDNIEILNEKYTYSIENNEFIKLVLSKVKFKNSDLKKIVITPILIKSIPKQSFRYTYKTKDIVKNYSNAESVIKIVEYLTNNFLNADLKTIREDIQFISNKKGNSKIIIKEPLFKEVRINQHDSVKIKRIDTEGNLYLQSLGITDKDFKIKKNMHDKFRQINKYLEIIDSLSERFNKQKSIRIVDMGSGKGYLTFALYDYLKNSKKISVSLTGIEIREDLVNTCNITAEKCRFNDLKFKVGSITDFKEQNIDILIALHACDTATDDAIYSGIRSKAKLIIVAPCCQKQIRKAMNITNGFSSIMKYGILKERQAEILTDGLRAMFLEASGYNTKVFEFISTEHTAKNIMITAEKSTKQKNINEISLRIKNIKKQFGIEKHYLEVLLGSITNNQINYES